MKVLHVLNYGWPYIDGYTARSIGLTGAQRQHLDGVDVFVATSPFAPLAHGVDEAFRTDHWSAERQIRALAPGPGGAPHGLRGWERPAVGLAPLTSAAFGRELERAAREIGADLIHVHHPHYVADVALRVAARLDVPAVYELRCFNGNYDLGTRSLYKTLRGRWQNELEFALARDASAVVTIGEALANTLRAHGVDEERLFVVRNSVDTDRFVPGTTRTPWAQRWSSRSGDRAGITRTDALPLHVGYATTFERMENLDAAVEATCIAREALRTKNIALTLTLAGSGRDWTRIAELVEARGAGDFVKLPGHVSYSRMPDFYRDLDLFLVPRGAHVVAMDTTPLKPLEALACGLPLLVTDLPAMRELLQAREDVRFTTPDARSMARSLIDFAEAPWRGGGDIAERAWALEVQRYAAIYAAAARHGSPRPSGRRRLVAALRRGERHAPRRSPA